MTPRERINGRRHQDLLPRRRRRINAFRRRRVEPLRAAPRSLTASMAKRPLLWRSQCRALVDDESEALGFPMRRSRSTQHHPGDDAPAPVRTVGRDMHASCCGCRTCSSGLSIRFIKRLFGSLPLCTFQVNAYVARQKARTCWSRRSAPARPSYLARTNSKDKT